MKGINKKEFEEFTKEMWKRLKEGERKYGTTFKNSDLKKEMLSEATDLANYSFMLYLQAIKYNNKIK